MKISYLSELRADQAIAIKNAAASCHWTVPSDIAYVADVETQSLTSENGLRDLISELSPSARTEMAALYWLGRKAEGEDKGDWNQLVERARTLQVEVDYLCGKLNLTKCISNGLMELECNG